MKPVCPFCLRAILARCQGRNANDAVELPADSDLSRDRHRACDAAAGVGQRARTPVGTKQERSRETVTLRVRLRSFRRQPHEIRRALLPRRHPLHCVRPRDRLPVSLGRGARQSGTFGLVAMAIFLAILVVGFIYEWKKGALEWD